MLLPYLFSMAPISRTRTRPYRYGEIIRRADGSVISTTEFSDFREYFRDSIGNRHGENTCEHFTLLQGAVGPWMKQTSSNPPPTREWLGASRMSETRSYFATYVEALLNQQVYFPLEFIEDNSFELLNFVAELDDTIAIFTRKFWKDMSFGSLNWGILPFVSDLKSLHSTLVTFLSGGFTRAFNKYLSKTYRVYPIENLVIDLSSTSTVCSGSFDGKLRLSGEVKLSRPDFSAGMTSLLIFLDELGVHPDLRTVWDLIPLSFIFDYYLPVGDILESVHPRGWFEPEFIFSGQYSLDGVFKMKTPVSRTQTVLAERTQRTYDVYYRQVLSRARFPARKPRVVDFKAPSLRQLFNTAYIGLGHKKIKYRFDFNRLDSLYITGALFGALT